jgi:hypothetical protein
MASREIPSGTSSMLETAHRNPQIEQQAGLRANERFAPRKTAFPRSAQWHYGSSVLNYRCGGSTGLGLVDFTGFPFHPWTKPGTPAAFWWPVMEPAHGETVPQARES